MQGKLNVTKVDSSVVSLDILSGLVINGKKYILSTANEMDQNGLVKILASEVLDGKAIKIESDSDWTEVKNAMRSIISSSKGDFEYHNFGDSISLTAGGDTFARVIAIQEVAKDELIKDYSAKRPELVVPEVKVEVKDPNSAIYPEGGNNDASSSSEVVPGISEIDTNNQTSEIVTNDNKPVEDEPVVQDINPEPVVTKVEDNNTQTVNNLSEPVVKIEGDSPRDILVSKIMAAVDEYLASTNSSSGNSEISALKSNIASMQEQLKAMSASLND